MTATLEPKPMRRQQQYEWRVTYRRRWWAHSTFRIYQSRFFADRFVARVLGPYGDLEPVVELHVQRRTVGEWSTVLHRGDDDGLIDDYLDGGR